MPAYVAAATGSPYAGPEAQPESAAEPAPTPETRTGAETETTTAPGPRPHAPQHPHQRPHPHPHPRPQLPALPASPADWHYRPPAAAPSWWPSWWHRHSRTVRLLALGLLLALCGLTILSLVREETGTLGLLVGLGLAVLPVPLLVFAFRWIDGVEPAPWREHLFAFAWGACAATLVALLTNSLAADWLNSSVVVDSPGRADALGSTLVAPIVEETAKAAALLLLFVFRRRAMGGVVSALATAGITATGFAFTENVLYLGTAFGEDQLITPDALHESATATTFFIRIVLVPFAHPLFTSFIGLAFGVLAALPGARRPLRLLLPLLGLLTSALLHSIWNGSASLPNATFLVVYALFMIPVFAAMTWLALWSRHDELRTVRETLPAYAAAGWFAAPEPWALSSMRARAMARSLARRQHGPAGARAVTEYQHFATALAHLRATANAGSPPHDFAAREQELLHHLWTRHPLASPSTTSAALTLTRPRIPAQWGAYGGRE